MPTGERKTTSDTKAIYLLIVSIQNFLVVSYIPPYAFDLGTKIQLPTASASPRVSRITMVDRSLLADIDD